MEHIENKFINLVGPGENLPGIVAVESLVYFKGELQHQIVTIFRQYPDGILETLFTFKQDSNDMLDVSSEIIANELHNLRQNYPKIVEKILPRFQAKPW